LDKKPVCNFSVLAFLLFSALFFLLFGIWGPRSASLWLADRRYAAGLTGLFGPSAAFGGFGLAFGHPSAALGRYCGLKPTANAVLLRNIL